MRIDWAAKVQPGQLLQALFVAGGVCIGVILWYVGEVTTNLNQDNRMDKIEARLTTNERLNDKWQSDEKENLTGIRKSVERLLDVTVDLKLAVAKISANGGKGNATR